VGSSYQTVLATGELTDVRAAVAASGQQAVVIPAGPARWAVVPFQQDGYAETGELARLLSRPPGALAASFNVFDSDVMAIGLYRDGRNYHDYLSDQEYVTEAWDDDENEIQVDFLGREYPEDATLPAGPYGADPAAFTPLAVGEVDERALTTVLTGEYLFTEEQHAEMLQLLGIDARPLQFTYAEAVASGLGV
jgi:hypothetical protein